MSDQSSKRTIHDLTSNEIFDIATAVSDVAILQMQSRGVVFGGDSKDVLFYQIQGVLLEFCGHDTGVKP